MSVADRSAGGGRVAVVDEDSAHVTTLCQTLGAARWKAEPFDSKDGVLRGIEQESCGFDVLLSGLDAAAPATVGLADELRARCPHLTLVLVTSLGDQEASLAAARIGAWDHLRRPASGPALIRMVERASERTRLLFRNSDVERQLAAVASDARDLERAIERAAALLGDTLRPLAEAREDFERRYAREVLARTGGNLTAAARLSGVDRSNFRRLLRRLGIDTPND